jgi:hypothetical protein
MTCSAGQPTQVVSPCSESLPCLMAETRFPHCRPMPCFTGPRLRFVQATPPQFRSGAPPFTHAADPDARETGCPIWSPVGWCTAFPACGVRIMGKRDIRNGRSCGLGACDLSHLPPPTPSVHLWVLPQAVRPAGCRLPEPRAEGKGLGVHLR